MAVPFINNPCFIPSEFKLPESNVLAWVRGQCDYINEVINFELNADTTNWGVAHQCWEQWLETTDNPVVVFEFADAQFSTTVSMNIFDYDNGTDLGAVSLTNITGNVYYAYLDQVTLGDAKALATNDVIQLQIRITDGVETWAIAKTEPILLKDPTYWGVNESVLINYYNDTLFDLIPYGTTVSSEAFSSVDDNNGYALIVGGGSADTSLDDTCTITGSSNLDGTWRVIDIVYSGGSFYGVVINTEYTATDSGTIAFSYPRIKNNLRLDAGFWKSQTRQDKSVYVRTDGEVILPVQRVSSAQVLQTNHMPMVMHRKLARVFAHNTILVDGNTYKASTEYIFDSELVLSSGQIELTLQSSRDSNLI